VATLEQPHCHVLRIKSGLGAVLRPLLKPAEHERGDDQQDDKDDQPDQAANWPAHPPPLSTSIETPVPARHSHSRHFAGDHHAAERQLPTAG
jgi:hypothetical protein